METKLKLFKFYKAERGEFLFQVIDKKIPYIVRGVRYGNIGTFLIDEEEVDKNEYVEKTKEEFLEKMKVILNLIQNEMFAIENTSEEEYEEKRKIWAENYKDSITPFEEIKILLSPESIKDEKTIDWICQGDNEKDKETIKNIFEEFSKSGEKMIEKSIVLTDKKIIHLLYRQ